MAATLAAGVAAVAAALAVTHLGDVFVGHQHPFLPHVQLHWVDKQPAGHRRHALRPRGAIPAQAGGQRAPGQAEQGG